MASLSDHRGMQSAVVHVGEVEAAKGKGESLTQDGDRLQQAVPTRHKNWWEKRESVSSQGCHVTLRSSVSGSRMVVKLLSPSFMVVLRAEPSVGALAAFSSLLLCPYVDFLCFLYFIHIWLLWVLFTACGI